MQFCCRQARLLRCHVKPTAEGGRALVMIAVVELWGMQSRMKSALARVAPALTATDRVRVARLLGRSPEGAFEVVVRDRQGDPVVIRNAPLLDDGRPMPTRYWLVGETIRRAVDRLEADGGVRMANEAVDPQAVAAAHRRYATERNAALPRGYSGPALTAGVGGTRSGVKCLHAHLAWYLAGGDDPVGRWVAGVLALDAVADSVTAPD